MAVQVVFFFSGHGAEEQHATKLWGIDFQDPIDVNAEIIYKLRRKADSLVIVILLDCCRKDPSNFTYASQPSSPADNASAAAPSRRHSLAPCSRHPGLSHDLRSGQHVGAQVLLSLL